MGVKVTGLKEFTQFTGNFPVAIERTKESVLKQEARGLCVEMGAGTMPGPGFQEGPAVAFRGRVEGDVRRVFLTREDTARIFKLIERRSKGLAYGFLRASKAGDEAQMRRYLREAGIRVETLNPAVHRAARTGPQGRVPKGHAAVDVVSGPQLRAYVRKQQQLVGFAKAGWYAAAKALGGRVRINRVDADGKRRTEETFPAYVRRLARRFPGAGTAVIGKGRITVISNVRHAVDAIPQKFYDHAVYGAQERLRAALLRGVREARRRRGFGVAA